MLPVCLLSLPWLHYRNPTATILPTTEVVRYKPSPIVASFSSRGPSSLTENILKVFLPCVLSCTFYGLISNLVSIFWYFDVWFVLLPIFILLIWIFFIKRLSMVFFIKLMLTLFRSVIRQNLVLRVKIWIIFYLRIS